MRRAMSDRKPRYINPYTDFGFKKLFGEEGSKDLLIDFLNQLVANMTAEQRASYTDSLLKYFEFKAVIDTAVEEAEVEARRSIVVNMINAGYDDATISQLTDMPVQAVAALRRG